MSKKIKTAALAGLSALALASCSSTNKIAKEDNATKPNSYMDTDAKYLILSNDQRATINKGNEFAVNLFKTQIDMQSKVISPLSVSYLMGMLANGADGDTQKEILASLGVGDVTLQTLNESYRALLNSTATADKQTTINIANYIAADKHFSLKSDFRNTVGKMYDAGVESLDFSSSKAVDKINQWCSKQTNGMIPKIVDQLSASDVAVLMNAIYFEGTWETPFEKELTKEENFRGYTRDIKRVQMMHQEDDFSYLSNDTFEAVTLPYGNRTYNMTVLLPKEGVSIEEMMKLLDAQKIGSLYRDMEKCVVDLKLPKFTTSTEVVLNDAISKLGAPSIFTGAANFKNMSDASIFISKMLQKAKIEVSEEGTKAAAITAGMVAMTALNPNEPRHVKFHANRPFVYIITERQTGAIFFIGQYLGE
ncbi:serpin family protein [Leyella stercorea]|uniref:serpin family protein n=1 Tax=Leyella stercorea TaxID=363265 RepID=UPI00242AB84C|nr:serpin family protein [Leyella stercorea]